MNRIKQIVISNYSIMAIRK